MRDMKDSGFVWLGKIPKSWATKKVKQIFFQKKEKAFTDNPTILSLARDGVKIRDISTNEGQLAADYSTYNPVSKNDLLLNPMDLYSGDNCNISRIEGVISPAYVNLRNISQSDTPDFFNYYFKHQYWSMAFFAHGRGVSFENRWTLTNEVLRNYPVLYPSALEQQAIADYLDEECARIDGIVTIQRQIIERLKEYKKSVITEAVTRGLNPDVPMKDSGIEWIGKIPEHWEVSKVSFFFDIQLGKMVQPNKENEFDIERPYLCAVNFGNNTFKLDTIKTMWFSPAEIELYRVSVGDLFVVEGGDIASSDFVTHPLEDFGFQNALHRVRARASADTRFLRYLLIVAKNTGYIDLICNKATIAHFSKDKFQNMPFLVAPLSEQQTIANYLDNECARIDTIIEKRERMIELMTEYKKSLIYECVTGKKEVA